MQALLPGRIDDLIFLMPYALHYWLLGVPERAVAHVVRTGCTFRRRWRLIAKHHQQVDPLERVRQCQCCLPTHQYLHSSCVRRNSLGTAASSAPLADLAGTLSAPVPSHRSNRCGNPEHRGQPGVSFRIRPVLTTSLLSGILFFSIFFSMLSFPL